MIYTYSASGDFPNGFDSDDFHSRVQAAGFAPALIGVHSNDDEVKVEFATALSAAEKDTLDGVVGYAPSVAELLTVAKDAKYIAIDTRTTELIGAGFAYDGKVFSLSRQAQANLLGVQSNINKANRKGVLAQFEAAVFPLTFNTSNDLEKVEIADIATFDDFYDTAFGTVKAYLDSGTALKEAVRQAVDIAGVDAIVDNR